MERHPLDPVSLVFGLVFAVVALLGLTDLLALTGADLRWLGPALLVVLGVTLVVTAARRRPDAGAEADPSPTRAAADRAGSESSDAPAESEPQHERD